ncbi:ankyrin repeat-containing domain protein [Auriculariales sp. MPI-PUGE-AT-0066]|nr:ankyrin repeat-containing domain protein [Auriculariales sp. MPI-PUGE-AT-0066]
MAALIKRGAPAWVPAFLRVTIVVSEHAARGVEVEVKLIMKHRQRALSCPESERATGGHLYPTAPSSSIPDLTADDAQEALDCARYGDLDELRPLLTKYSGATLATIRDGGGNTLLHMASANGHDDVLSFLLAACSELSPNDPSAPAPATGEFNALLATQNNAGNTPLHWAALNAHLSTAQLLVSHGGPALIDVRNKAGRTPLGEAEEAGWDDGARWFVAQMELEEGVAEAADTKEEVPEEDADGLVDAKDVQFEVEVVEKDGTTSSSAAAFASRT